MRGGKAEHVVYRCTILGILVAVAPILCGDLPTFRGIVFTCFKTLKLRFGGNVHPELKQDGTPVDHVTLKLVDFLVCTAPLVGAGKTLHALNQHTAVPTAVVNTYMARLRQTRPIAPQMRMQQFRLRRCRTGENGVGTRIQCLRNTLDAATLSGCIPAFIHDHHGYAPNVHFQLDTT